MEKLSNPQKTIEIIQKYGFDFQKKFGQNFLIDPRVLDKLSLIHINGGRGTKTAGRTEKRKRCMEA